MKYLALTFAWLFSFSAMAQNTISPEDLRTLIDEWTGTLTYLDYSSNEPFTMPANVTVKEGKNEFQLILFYAYPNEPQANSKGKISISKNGEQINGNPITARKKLPGGETEFTTESTGKDNNQKALIQNIYTLGRNRFVTTKKVKFENQEEWLKRNEFNYTRGPK